MTKHILIVDDDAVFAEAIGSILRQAGYQVDIAGHFDAALKRLEGGRIDVLLTDIVMPSGVNGVALARMARLRQPALAVVYLTGFDVPGIEREALFGTLLRKPVDQDKLIQAIEERLASPRRIGPEQ